MFSTGKITPAWVWHTMDPLRWTRTVTARLTFTALTLTGGLEQHSVSLELRSVQGQWPPSPNMCGLFLFVKCTVALTNGYKPFWGKARGEHLQCKISVRRQDLFSWMTWPMLHSRDFRFVSVNKFSARKWLRGMTIIMIKARLPFARKDLYHLHISSNTIIIFDLFLYKGHFGQPQILCWPNHLVFSHFESPHGPCHCKISLSTSNSWSLATWAPKSLWMVTAVMKLKGT